MNLRQEVELDIVPAEEKGPRKKLKLKNVVPYLFILPSTLMIAIFLFYPIGTVFYYSLQNYDVSAPFYNGFAGLENFKKIFTQDKLFFPSLWISFKWVVSQVGLQLIFGLSAALLLNQKFKFRGMVRAAAFIPWAISGVLASVMWSLMFNEHMGVINDILLRLGVISESKAWLADSTTAFISVIIAELWRGIPFFAITLLAALQSIPEELYEAAKVDGAGRVKSFWFVTLPQLKNTIVLTTLLLFNLTGGGPAHSTTTLTMYIAEQAVHGSNFGYGSALTVVAFGILFIFAAVYLRITRFEREEN
jgi:multiple sugar transport system permease protein